ncbi:hypothetical protein O181_016301 [Austropuccinia psidii MF-1]|uniref:Uncharacterized protein n=1 Tax=Austropuccinia psidii MF-1 TaxID=1389203 RepID=A0A9Q3C5C7_9BASI|nr:hypothetical protein [Austropuccinia psidii MF-1]
MHPHRPPDVTPTLAHLHPHHSLRFHTPTAYHPYAHIVPSQHTPNAALTLALSLCYCSALKMRLQCCPPISALTTP